MNFKRTNNPDSSTWNSLYPLTQAIYHITDEKGETSLDFIHKNTNSYMRAITHNNLTTVTKKRVLRHLHCLIDLGYLSSSE